ncbi:GTPase IMAP family member 7 [Colossoma macropomum]|uniref:GTPase IMAP family member 7 n=1 Tax=Colossoma macropomum TaxID=42526 RepID=UPI001864A739|nr:GTPase IMAP family member 7 [Colossoma macropomum]
MASSKGQDPPIKRRRQSIEKPPTMCIGDTSLRIVIFGNTGPHQFSLTESILQRAVFDGVDPNATLTTKTSGHVLERNVMLVNTPNLNTHCLAQETLKKEFRKSICFSCPGPHAVLFILNPIDVPPDPYGVFKPVVQYFGESILNHAMVVLYDERELVDSETEIEELKEFIQKCGQRCFIFSGEKNREEGSMTRQLFHKIDQMVSEHKIYSNPEFKDADKRIKKEEKFLEKERQKEVKKMLEALKNEHSGEDYDREVKLYQEKMHLENRERAEMLIADRLGFTLRLVDYAAAIGKGAFVGAVLGIVMGPEGMAVGATVGAALGGVLGGAAGATWNYFTGVFADVR